jgi:G3E family GTPase
MNLDKILKTAMITFEDVPQIEKIVKYIRDMQKFFGDKQSDAVQNALVQIASPDMVMISQHDLDVLKNSQSRYENLKESYNALSANYDELQLREEVALNRAKNQSALIDTLNTEIAHLQQSRGLCQLNSKGVCSYCDKRILLASSVGCLRQDDESGKTGE